MIHAILNMLLGMGTVFIVLIIISFIIYGFNVFAFFEKRHKERMKSQVPIETAKKEVMFGQTEATSASSEELVAVITAAITAYTGLNKEDFIVRSIVRKKGRN